MGLLEYQVMPYLRHVSSRVYKIPSARSWVAPVRATGHGTENADGTVRPSRIKSHLPGHSPRASQRSRRVGPTLYTSASLVIPLPRENPASQMVYVQIFNDDIK
jgi:hypothetical protein